MKKSYFALSLVFNANLLFANSMEFVTTKNGRILKIEQDVAREISVDEKSDEEKAVRSTWPNGVVYYVVDDTLLDYPEYEDAFLQACNAWSQVARVQCRKANPNRDRYYVLIQAAEGSSSEVGFKRQPGQYFGMGSTRVDVMIHEFGHVLGFEHEHNRADRDRYVTINWNNIRPNKAYEYEVLSDYYQNTPYDLNSIMHYPAISGNYAIDRNRPCIIAKNGQRVFGQELMQMSHYDGVDAANLYGR